MDIINFIIAFVIGALLIIAALLMPSEDSDRLKFYTDATISAINDTKGKKSYILEFTDEDMNSVRMPSRTITDATERSVGSKVPVRYDYKTIFGHRVYSVSIVNAEETPAYSKKGIIVCGLSVIALGVLSLIVYLV